LIYLESKIDDENEAKQILLSFCEKVSGTVQVIPIGLVNTLEPLETFHFNNSIIYKALIPSIVPDEEFILNLDAGLLPGARFEDLLKKIFSDLVLRDSEWVLGAYCSSSEKDLVQNLLAFEHNSLYPAGVMMLFNTKNYVKVGWSNRYLKNYEKYKNLLVYAEQDLICLTARQDEIIELPYPALQKVIFLRAVFQKTNFTKALNSNRDYTFLKLAGSFKPWHYWVLDPNKLVYLQRRAELEKIFPLRGKVTIENQRIKALRPEWPIQFARAYDEYLSREEPGSN
jgi:lipopolysaccharide biosynthesis glycosyltransferase